jgi:hypothetical protein
MDLKDLSSNTVTSDEAWLAKSAAGARAVLADMALDGIDTAFLRSPRFIDYSRKDYLLQRGQRTYVDRTPDARDAFLMTEWTRSVKHAKGFGRSYKRGQFERAFAGCSAEDVRKAGA